MNEPAVSSLTLDFLLPLSQEAVAVSPEKPHKETLKEKQDREDREKARDILNGIIKAALADTSTYGRVADKKG